MKPVTPQDFAACYGTLYANVNISGLPTLATWFGTTFPEIVLSAKLNPGVFGAYTPTLDKFPRPGATRSLGREGLAWANADAFKQGMLYNDTIDPYWTTLNINLKNAMTLAEADPGLLSKNVAALNKIKPIPQTRVGK